MKILQLRQAWTATPARRAGWPAIPDQFLSYGGPPIPLVRAQMMGSAPEAKLWAAAP
jgi:hypothetical protein